MSCAETAAPIEMLFGLRTPEGLRNQIPVGRGNFEGGGAAHCRVQGHSAVSCAKSAEPIEMPFGMSY